MAKFLGSFRVPTPMFTDQRLSHFQVLLYSFMRGLARQLGKQIKLERPTAHCDGSLLVSHSHLAKMTGKSTITIRNACGKLCKLGYLRAEQVRSGDCNTYYFDVFPTTSPLLDTKDWKILLARNQPDMSQEETEEQLMDEDESQDPAHLGVNRP